MITFITPQWIYSLSNYEISRNLSRKYIYIATDKPIAIGYYVENYTRTGIERSI